ncbi:RYamide receptor [Ischnura elegans]|uniref:RYamide receptor n=1 Tax=Ischnura elegans TaxID=197161 RepID=UPI001ED88C77|nr:RYamide receptor [Ischnura elegans]
MSELEDAALFGNVTGPFDPQQPESACDAVGVNCSLPLGNSSSLDETLNCSATQGSGRMIYNTYFQAAIYFSYCSIFVAALCGNGLVCYVVHASPRMRTVTNYFIANLAVGDVLMTLFCVPFSFVPVLVLQYWPFGDSMCRMVSYSQGVSVLVSAYTLVAISLDRYMAIMRPLRPRLSKKGAAGAVAGVWVFALATASPIPIVSQLTQPIPWYQHCSLYLCTEEWPSHDLSYRYSMALMSLQYITPLTVLVATYARIAAAVWGKRTPGEAENSRDQRMARSKRKMIKMMVTVVIVFTVCWLPLNVLLVMTDGDLVDWDCLPYLWWAFHWLAMSHSCYNPIIYCWMNAKFRVGFCCALSRVPCLRWLARRLTPGPNTSCSSAFGGATITHVGGGRSIGPRGRPSTSMGPSTTSSFLVFKGGNNGKCAGSSRPGSVLLGPSIHQYGGGGGRGQNRRSSRNRDSDIDMEVDEASLLHRVDTGTSYVSVRRANSSGKTNGESVNLTDNGNNGDFGSGNLHHGRGRYHHHHHRTHQTEMEDKI